MSDFETALLIFLVFANCVFVLKVHLHGAKANRSLRLLEQISSEFEQERIKKMYAGSSSSKIITEKIINDVGSLVQVTNSSVAEIGISLSQFALILNRNFKDSFDLVNSKIEVLSGKLEDLSGVTNSKILNLAKDLVVSNNQLKNKCDSYRNLVSEILEEVIPIGSSSSISVSSVIDKHTLGNFHVINSSIALLNSQCFDLAVRLKTLIGESITEERSPVAESDEKETQ